VWQGKMIKEGIKGAAAGLDSALNGHEVNGWQFVHLGWCSG